MKMTTLRFIEVFERPLYRPKETSGPAMAIEKQLAPSVVRPPCASRTAWKIRTMSPRTLVAVGPKSMAPRPVPVMCELEPVTLGILSEEITNTNAPASASSVSVRRFLASVFLIDWKPTTTNGRLMTPHAMQY